MTAEEYFKKEFKAYLDYKAHIMNGAGNDIYLNDARVSAVMHTLPQGEAYTYDTVMCKQLAFLRGIDLGCELTQDGRLKSAEFLRKCLPDFVQKEILSGTEYKDYCVIKDVTEPYFSSLNNSLVVLQPRISYKKRITGSDNQFLKDQNGNVMTRDVDIPMGSRVVSSHKSIHLPNFVSTDSGARRRHIISDGYGYLDFVKDTDNLRYLYYLPRENIYTVNVNALVLTTSRLHSKYYWGRQYFFNRGIPTAYLYVMPYTASILKAENVVFYLKMSVDFTHEISLIEKYWQSSANASGVNGLPHPSIMYNPQELTLTSTMGFDDSGDTTLAYKTLPEPSRDPYVPVGAALDPADEIDDAPNM